MQRHVIVLAASVQEGVTYARRKGLPARSYRSPARAASIRGIRNCEVHVLPTFRGRRDAHAILAELRYAKCEFIDVEMPEPLEPAPVDQGDGMGEQLDLPFDQGGHFPTIGALTPEDWANRHALSLAAYSVPRTFMAGVAKEQDEATPSESSEDSASPAPRKRRTRCGECGELTFEAHDHSPKPLTVVLDGVFD